MWIEAALTLLAQRACTQVLDAVRLDDGFVVVGLDADSAPVLEELDAALTPTRKLPLAVQFPEAVIAYDGAYFVAGHDGDPPHAAATVVKVDAATGDPLAKHTLPDASFRDLVRDRRELVAVGIGDQHSDRDGDVLLVRYDLSLTVVGQRTLGGAGQDLARSALIDGTELVLAVQTQGGIAGAPLERDDIDAWLVAVDADRFDHLRVIAKAAGPGFDVLKDVDKQGDALIAVGATQPTKPASLDRWPQGPPLHGLIVVVDPHMTRVERRPSVSSFWDVIGRAATAHAYRDDGFDAVLAPWRGGAPFVRCPVAGQPTFAPVARGHRTWMLGHFASEPSDSCTP